MTDKTKSISEALAEVQRKVNEQRMKNAESNWNAINEAPKTNPNDPNNYGSFSTNNNSKYGFAAGGSSEDNPANFFASSRRMMDAQKAAPSVAPATKPVAKPTTPVAKPSTVPLPPKRPTDLGARTSTPTLTPAQKQVAAIAKPAAPNTAGMDAAAQAKGQQIAATDTKVANVSAAGGALANTKVQSPAQIGAAATPRTFGTVAATTAAGQADKDQIAKNNAATGRTDGINPSVVGGLFDPANIAKARQANIADIAARAAKAGGSAPISVSNTASTPTPPPRPAPSAAAANTAPASTPAPSAAAAPTIPSIRSTISSYNGPEGSSSASAPPTPTPPPRPAPSAAAATTTKGFSLWHPSTWFSGSNQPQKPAQPSQQDHKDAIPAAGQNEDGGPSKSKGKKSMKEEMSPLVAAFLKLQESKPANMFEAAKKMKAVCPKCGKSPCVCESMEEEKELSPKQKKIAALGGDKKKLDAADFKALRSGKKPDIYKNMKEETVFVTKRNDISGRKNIMEISKSQYDSRKHVLVSEGNIRLVKTHEKMDSEGQKRTAKVYKDHEWNEYRVKHFTNGKYHHDADYHTDDADDAHNTAKAFLKEEIILEKNWIAGAIKHPGAETRAAEKAGMSVQAYAKKHEHDPGTAGKRARLAMTLKKINKEEVDFSEEELAHFASVIEGDAPSVAPARDDIVNRSDKHDTNSDYGMDEEAKKRGVKAGTKRGPYKQKGLSSDEKDEAQAETKNVPAQVRTARSHFSGGKEVVTLKHPQTDKQYHVPLKHVNDFNKEYAAAEKPHEKNAVERKFMQTHMSN
jgi:hypothetical protein